MVAAAKSHAFSRVTLLSSRLDEIDLAAETAEQMLAELRSRREALVERLATLSAGRPSSEPTQTEHALVDALAADPSSTPEQAALLDVVDRQASLNAAVNAWSTSVTLHQRAIEKIDREIAGASDAANERVRERDSAWREFVTEAHSYLIEQFRHQFRRLYDEVLAPIVGIEQLREADGSHRLIPHGTPLLSTDSAIRLVSYNSARGQYMAEQFFPRLFNPNKPEECGVVPRTNGYGQEVCRPSIDRFRDALRQGNVKK